MPRFHTYTIEAHGSGETRTARARTFREAMTASGLCHTGAPQLVQSVEGGEVWADGNGWHHTVRITQPSKMAR